MKIIKFTDYIKVNPDARIKDIEKDAKIKIIDNLIERSDKEGKGLLVTYDLSHSGRRINNRVYSLDGQQRGIDSLTKPYAKPILLNHDTSKDPIGRFVGGQWQDLSQQAMPFFDNVESYFEFRKAMESADTEKKYRYLKMYDLLNNKEWPGLGRMRVQANITDEESIKKFLDGRYLTFSAGSTTDSHICSICGQDWAKDGMCEHSHGKMYDDELCVFFTGDFKVIEGSVVNTPADDLSQVLHMEMMDSRKEEIEFKDSKDIEFILTDSYIDSIKEKEDGTSWNGVQNPEQIDSNKEKEEEKEEEEMNDKEFDYMLIVSEEKMKQLHSTGKTDVIAVSGKERMTIRLIYRTKENTKGGEDSEQFLNELFVDEKMFKVPAGAKGNARKVLEWKKKHGSEVKGMTPVGWARARQLANQSEIPLSTVKRMAAFNRHRKNAVVAPEFKSTPWKDRGYVAWLGWGGDSGVNWAVKTSAANDSEVIETMNEDAYRSSPKGKGAKTPAKPSERIKGSKKNKPGSAATAKGGIKTSARILKTLQEKVRSHNEKHGDKKGKKVTLGMLKAVWRRGAGAFSSTHRPGMSRDGWGIARVNAFLKLVRSGSPSNPKYKQDNDLLPAGHPRKSSSKAKDMLMDTKEDLVVDETLEVTSVDEEVEQVEETPVTDASDTEVVEEVEEATESDEEIESSDEEFEFLDEEVDWEMLDLALAGFMNSDEFEDARLSYQQRKDLPDSAFCGPERSFPVPDCAHVTAAKRLINQSKLSDAQKAKVMTCVNKKSDSMSCGKKDSSDERYTELLASYKESQDKIAELEDKILKILETISLDSEKNNDKVENTETNEVNVLEQSVENPSAHSDEEAEVKLTAKDSNLGSFEQSVVNTYNEILKTDSKDNAELFLLSKANYLPRGFHPSKV